MKHRIRSDVGGSGHSEMSLAGSIVLNLLVFRKKILSFERSQKKKDGRQSNTLCRTLHLQGVVQLFQLILERDYFSEWFKVIINTIIILALNKYTLISTLYLHEKQTAPLPLGQGVREEWAASGRNHLSSLQLASDCGENLESSSHTPGLSSCSAENAKWSL